MGVPPVIILILDWDLPGYTIQLSSYCMLLWVASWRAAPGRAMILAVAVVVERNSMASE